MVVVVPDVAAEREHWMSDTPNPYRWDAQTPGVAVPRTELVAEVVEHLTRGTGVVFLAGRGMGKSVLLRNVEKTLNERGGVTVVRLPGPPTVRTLDACLAAIADALGVPFVAGTTATALVRDHLAHGDDRRAVCLLYDEVDQYATLVEGEPLSRLLFNHLEVARKELEGQLGVMAAGGLGLFHLRSVDASPFISRAVRLRLRPFDDAQLAVLAAPLHARHATPHGEFMAVLAALSGGNPALATWGLQRVWSSPEATPETLVEAFDRFAEEQRDFVWAFHKGVFNEALSEAPRLTLDLVRRSDGLVPLRDLWAACAEGARDGGIAPLDPHDAVDVLECAGLIRREGSLRTDPVRLRAVATMLSLSALPSRASTLREQLIADLARVLADLHAMAVDFFRSSQKGQKELVPEAVFCAFIALGLRLLGWTQVEREAALVAGRTDVKGRHGSFPGEVAVVEVKIWTRNDYDAVHDQVASYWSAEVSAAAVVMLSDAKIDAWPEDYRTKCLSAVGVLVEPRPGAAPLRAVLTARSSTPDGVAICVEHHLLRLPRG